MAKPNYCLVAELNMAKNDGSFDIFVHDNLSGRIKLLDLHTKSYTEALRKVKFYKEDKSL